MIGSGLAALTRLRYACSSYRCVSSFTGWCFDTDATSSGCSRAKAAERRTARALWSSEDAQRSVQLPPALPPGPVAKPNIERQSLGASPVARARGGMALAPSQLAPGRGVAPGRVANAGAHRPSRMRQSGPAALRTLPMGAGDAGPRPRPLAQGPVGVMIRGPPIRPLGQATSAYFKSMLTYIVTTSLVRVP